MILMTGYALGTVPFHNVYLTGIIRDKQGRKFSKSLGNGIDPIDIAQKFGTDAGRMALIVGNTPGTDMKMSEDKIKAYKNFSNKIWNITRFVLENTERSDLEKKPEMTDADQGLLDELSALVADMTKDMENFRFYMASEKIYHYLWHRFADIILEESKKIFASGGEQEKSSRRLVLREILKTSMKLLHPFMPYVTEEIWSMMPQKNKEKKNLLMAEKWPTND
jgi:valyl-tRNA synthetase